VNSTELADDHAQRLTSVSVLALFSNSVEPEASSLFLQKTDT
jgi:hypothetical protein